MGGMSERAWLSESDDDKVLSLCKIPFWQSSSGGVSSGGVSSGVSGGGGGGGGGVSGGGGETSSSLYDSSNRSHHHDDDDDDDDYNNKGKVEVGRVGNGNGENGVFKNVRVSSIAKSLLPPRRRLRLHPSHKLFFPYEPGKQVRSAISIKNISKSHVAFKFQTTAPKSCYMRPPGGILAPGETLVAVVFKFVEPPESNEKAFDHKSRVKFKIMSLKVSGDHLDYFPELFEELRDKVSVEKILQVVFLDAEHPSAALEMLKRQLAEADAAIETRRKPQQDSGPRISGEGLVIDEWKERRKRYLAQQNGEVSN